MWADDLETNSLNALQRLSARDKRRQQDITQRAILEQQLPQIVTVNRDVSQRLGDDCREEDRLSREEVQLAKETRAAVADDLLASSIENGNLALDDRDEGIALVADPVEDITHARGELVAERGERRQLRC